MIGVISDTHGLLRPEALEALADVSLVIHAGDVGQPQILEDLARIAPVRAVHGNIDRPPLSDELPLTEVVQVCGKTIYILHDLSRIDLDPTVAGFDVVVSGHTHKPRVARHGSVLFLNPGSAGPRRFSLPVSLALLDVGGIRPEVTVIELDV